MKLTSAATDRLKDIFEQTDAPAIGFRVSVQAGGCAGFTYQLGIKLDLEPGDEIVDAGGLKILIDQTSVEILKDVTLDFGSSGLDQKFIFTNPNANRAAAAGSRSALNLGEKNVIYQ